MSVAVVSPGSSTAASPRTRAAASLAAKAYAALQHNPTQQIGQTRHTYGHHDGQALASPDSKATQASTAKPPIQGALNILA